MRRTADKDCIAAVTYGECSNSEQSCVNWGLVRAELRTVLSGECLGSFIVLWGQEGGGSRGRFNANSHVLHVPVGGS